MKRPTRRELADKIMKQGRELEEERRRQIALRELMIHRGIAKLQQALHEATCALNALGTHDQEELDDLGAANEFAASAAEAFAAAYDALFQMKNPGSRRDS